MSITIVASRSIHKSNTNIWSKGPTTMVLPCMFPINRHNDDGWIVILTLVVKQTKRQLLE